MDKAANDLQTLLQQLHGIHEPPPIPWWPPAIGWWIVAGLLLLIIPVGLWIWRVLQRKRRQRQWKSMINTEIQRIEKLLQMPTQANAALMEISILLRRISITKSGNRQQAGRTGEAWLQQLTEHLVLSPQEQEHFRLLLTEPYRPQPNTANIAPVLALLRERLERWL